MAAHRARKAQISCAKNGALRLRVDWQMRGFACLTALPSIIHSTARRLTILLIKRSSPKSRTLCRWAGVRVTRALTVSLDPFCKRSNPEGRFPRKMYEHRWILEARSRKWDRRTGLGCAPSCVPSMRAGRDFQGRGSTISSPMSGSIWTSLRYNQRSTRSSKPN